MMIIKNNDYQVFRIISFSFMSARRPLPFQIVFFRVSYPRHTRLTINRRRRIQTAYVAFAHSRHDHHYSLHSSICRYDITQCVRQNVVVLFPSLLFLCIRQEDLLDFVLLHRPTSQGRRCRKKTNNSLSLSLSLYPFQVFLQYSF